MRIGKEQIRENRKDGKYRDEKETSGEKDVYVDKQLLR